MTENDIIDICKDYPNKVLSGEIVACEYIKLACKRYLNFLDKYEFRARNVANFVNFCSKLHHYTGKSAGTAFKLTPFQLWVACSIYGFYKEDGSRLTQNVYLEMARKNGKSFFAAAMCLFALIGDNEPASEVELVANSAKQAGISFSMCDTLLQGIDRKGKYFKFYRDKIKFPKNNAFLQVLSTDAKSSDGWNSHTFLVDEYHSAPNSAMYDVLKSSQGMRDNPLGIIITTAGFDLFGPCYQMRETNIDILNDLKQDDRTFVAIYTLDEGDDWQDPKNFEKANPNLNVTVKEQYLIDQITQAKNMPSMMVPVMTKNLNIWCSSASIWIPHDLLVKCSENIDDSFFVGKYINFVGVDLASVSDLTAVCIMCVDDNGKYYFKTRYYLPDSCLYNNPNSIKYREWKNQGYLTITPGNVTDYDYITEDLLRLTNNGVMINEVEYDMYNSTSWAIKMTEEGFNLKPFSQALWNFNKPTKEFERLLKMEKVVIDNNPITRWCFSNVALKTDHNENIKPVKSGDEMGKIDGVIAMIEALGGYLESPHYNNSIFIV